MDEIPRALRLVRSVRVRSGVTFRVTPHGTMTQVPLRTAHLEQARLVQRERDERIIAAEADTVKGRRTGTGSAEEHRRVVVMNDSRSLSQCAMSQLRPARHGAMPIAIFTVICTALDVNGAFRAFGDAADGRQAAAPAL